MKKNVEVNPYVIDHIVMNVDLDYQEDNNFIEKVNQIGLPYKPSKGKGNKGFKASNFWIGNEYFELVHIKSQDGGGWLKKWVEKYNDGHRGVIGLFLKTDKIDDDAVAFKGCGLSQPQRITFRFFFNLLKFSAKWRNAYFPFFDGVPFQLGFQQIDNTATEIKMHSRMVPNSIENGIKGIQSIRFFGPFTDSDRKWLKSVFSCIEHADSHLELPLLKGQSLHFYNSSIVMTEVILDTAVQSSPKLQVENVTILC